VPRSSTALVLPNETRFCERDAIAAFESRLLLLNAAAQSTQEQQCETLNFLQLALFTLPERVIVAQAVIGKSCTPSAFPSSTVQAAASRGAGCSTFFLVELHVERANRDASSRT
jgi:hypothetical protein